MRPVSVSANGPGSEIEQLQVGLHGRWRQAARAVMMLLSAHGIPPSQIAALLDCHLGTDGYLPLRPARAATDGAGQAPKKQDRGTIDFIGTAGEGRDGRA